MKKWFITGATGFVGSQFLKKILLETNDEVFLLIRSKRTESANQRYQSLFSKLFKSSSLTQISEYKERVEIVEGDISQSKFGLEPYVYDRIVNNIDYIFHCAATTSFTKTIEQARQTNVNSVIEMLKFAKDISNKNGLKKFIYISTAYVNGKARDDAKESELVKGAAFFNSYEQSKHEAETVIRKHWNELPIVIARPSIIIGDSNTGEFWNLNTIYFFLKMYASGNKLTLGSPKNLLDLVPIDYVIDALFYIQSKDERGKCYVISAGDKSIPIINLYKMSKSVFIKYKLNAVECYFISAYVGLLILNLFKLYKTLINCTKKTTATERLLSFCPYLIMKKGIESNKTQDELAMNGIKLPDLERYFPTIIAGFLRK